MTAVFHHERPALAAPTESPTPRWRIARLEFLRLLRIAGPGRLAFLQGQLTQDVRLVTPAAGALAGWATAQGRLLLVGHLLDWQDAFWLTTPAAMAGEFAARLRKFVLRAKVSIEPADLELHGLMGAGSPGAPGFGGAQLPTTPLACVGGPDGFAARVAGDPARILLAARPGAGTPLPDAGCEPAPQAQWWAEDIRAGLPALLSAATVDAFVPQMVNLELLGGVSFAKGCYSGQEIITRTRHLGRVKRRMFRFRCQGDGGLVPGAAVYGPDREAGQVLTAVASGDGQELLAVVQLDALAGPLFADAALTRRLARLPLPYPVPEAPGG